MPDPYIPKNPNDLIRAADWNQIQIETRTDIEQHGHTGGEDGTPLGTAALADGAVTAAKLAPDVADAIEPGPGSITTEQLADGAVTGAKLASPLSLPELRVNERTVRPAFDHATVEWSWTVEQRAVLVPEAADINGLKPTLAGLADRVAAITNNGEEVSALFVLRVLTDHLEPDIVAALGPEQAYELLLDTRLEHALARLQLGDALGDHLSKAFELMTYAYEQQPEHIGLVLTAARECNYDLVEEIAGEDNGAELLTLVSERFPANQIPMLAGLATPLADSDMLPMLALDPVQEPGFDESVFEVEADLRVLTRGMCMMGIGTSFHAPRPGRFVVTYPPNIPSKAALPIQSMRLRERLRHHKDVTVIRGAMLWGISFGDAATPMSALVEMQMASRTMGGPDPVAPSDIVLTGKRTKQPLLDRDGNVIRKPIRRDPRIAERTLVDPRKLVER